MDRKNNKIRVVITGGGTGGHIEPAYAVASELMKSKDVEMFWIGKKDGSIEVRAQKDAIIFRPITTGKLRRYASIQNISDGVKTIVGFFQSIEILRKIKPDVVFSKSGYVSAPVVLAAKLLKIPIVIHESDIVLGLTNRLVARLAKIICCGFPIRYYPAWIRKKAIYTGNPVKEYRVSSEMTEIIGHKYNLNFKTLFILGGSQGSTAINHFIYSELSNFVKSFNVVHQVGKNNIEDAFKIKSKLTADEKLKYHPATYFSDEEMAILLSKSELAICRAGAGTMADLSHFGVPAILIPLPSAAKDHQRANAKYAERNGAIIYREQPDLTGMKLYNLVCDLASDKNKLAQLSKEISALNPKCASANIASIIRNEVRI